MNTDLSLSDLLDMVIQLDELEIWMIDQYDFTQDGEDLIVHTDWGDLISEYHHQDDVEYTGEGDYIVWDIYEIDANGLTYEIETKGRKQPEDFETEVQYIYKIRLKK